MTETPPSGPVPRYEPGMPGYVLRDWEVVDYECYELDGTGLWLRGPAPAPLEEGAYVTAIGAAQTFGCFCPRPYPALLAERLGMEVLNLGISGAGPSFFLQQPALLDIINGSALCIVQAMSGRSTSNSLLDNPDGLAYGRRRADGALVTAETALGEVLAREQARIPIPERLKAILLAGSHLPIPAVRRVVQESREQWVRDYHALMQAITVPTVFFWFSERTPFYVPRYHRATAVFGRFPHLVNARMVRRVRPLADRYVACVSRRGLPQPLVSRFTGESVTIDLATDRKPGARAPLYAGVWEANRYYPSPQMHEDAAEALAAPCRDLVRRPAQPPGP
ncbi:MAG: DUF6473 family protein [Rubricoccaceae bacterium]|nr:DUF6473 family protein [Rubricoccaceae bacterium]